MKPHVIEARNIPDAWFKAVYDVQSNIDKTSKWPVDRGSFAGEERWDFDAPIILIDKPCEGDLSQRIAKNAEGSPLPNPIDPIIWPDKECPSCSTKMTSIDVEGPDFIISPCQCKTDEDFYNKNRQSEEQYILNYFSNYIFSDVVAPGEQYTYGSRILEIVTVYAVDDEGKENLIYTDLMKNFRNHMLATGTDHGTIDKDYCMIPQYYYHVSYLRVAPGSNQCVLQIAKPSDATLPDPPCLRHIDCRVMDGKLHFHIYFRSWDMYNGFPANLAAISLLMEQMCCDIDNVEPGSFVCYSKSLHLYSHHFEVAAARIGRAL